MGCLRGAKPLSQNPSPSPLFEGEGDKGGEVEMADDNQLTREEQAWLVEYECCQEYVDSAASRDWQIASIVWAAALAGLFILAFADNNCGGAIITTFLALITIVILCLFWKMVDRMVFFQKACMERMREIEHQLGMKRGIYFYLLDNWPKRGKINYRENLSDDELKKLQDKYLQNRSTAPRPHTSTATHVINVLIMTAWLGVTLWKWGTFLGWFS